MNDLAAREIIGLAVAQHSPTPYGILSKGEIMLTRLQADAICTFFLISTEVNWPTIVDNITGRVDIKDLCAGVKILANQAGVSEPFTQDDFTL